MGEKSVAIRLSTVGGEEARREVMAYADSGDAAAKRFAKAWVAADEQMEAMAARRERAQEKITSLLQQSPVQATAQAGASSGYTGGNARDSAQAIRDGLAQSAADDAKAKALLDILNPLRVAWERYNVAVAEASRLHDTGRISLEQFTALEEREAAMLERATGDRRSANQALAATHYQSAPDTTFVGKSAQQSAEAFGPLLAEQEKLTQRTNALRASIDPAFAAQQRFDHEMANAKDLISRGAISLDEYCAKLKQETTALGTASRGHGEHANMLGLNRSQFITAESAVIRFSDAVMAGASPLRAFMMEAHKGVEVMSLGDGGMAGALTKLRGLLGPVSLGIGALAAVEGIGAVAAYEYSSALYKLNAVAQGTGRVLGLTGDQIEAAAVAATDAGRISVSAAREIATAYLGVAKSGEVLTGLTAVTRDFAAATGQDLKGAEAELNKLFADPIKGAEELAGKYGMLSQAQIEHIQKLAEEGDAQKVQIELLRDLGPAVRGAADNINDLEKAWRWVKNAADGAFEAMGHAIDRALGGGSKLEQLETLQTRRAWALQAAGGNPFLLKNVADYDKQIADVKAAIAKDNGARGNQQAEQARGIIEQYSGDKRPEYHDQIGKLRAAIGGGALTPDQTKEAREGIEALTHAIQSYVPAAEKANMIAADRSLMRQGKTPQIRAAARARLVEDQARGEVVTPGNAALRAQDAAEGYHNRANAGGEKHAQTLAREAAAMEVNARASIELADAYLKGGDAAIIAEAKRKAATEATKKGIDIEAQTRRELQVMIGDQIANSAKSAAALHDENDARAAVVKQVMAGVVPIAQMNRALQDEAALRPLLKLQALVQGEALTELTKVITAYRGELARAHDEEAAMAAEQMIDGSKKRTAEFSAQITDLRHTPLNRQLNAAKRAANDQADDKGMAAGSEPRVRAVNAAVETAQAKYDYDKAAFVDQTTRSQRDGLELTRAEIGLAGKSEATRTAELDKLRMSQEIRRSFPDMAQKDVAAILAGVDAQDRANEKLKVAQASMEEVRSSGDRFIEDLTKPDGSGLMSLLHDVENELWKLAAINPLKNLLLGEKNPTLGSVFGSLFGGSGGGFDQDAFADSVATPNAGLQSMSDAMLPHNASGSESWSGGRTWVNENGPEIMDLPGGTRIYPASASRQMMANDNAPARVGVDISLNTEMFRAEVSSTADARIGAAAPGIAAGGAQLGQQQAARARRRQLGRRYG